MLPCRPGRGGVGTLLVLVHGEPGVSPQLLVHQAGPAPSGALCALWRPQTSERPSPPSADPAGGSAWPSSCQQAPSASPTVQQLVCPCWTTVTQTCLGMPQQQDCSEIAGQWWPVPAWCACAAGLRAPVAGPAAPLLPADSMTSSLHAVNLTREGLKMVRPVFGRLQQKQHTQIRQLTGCSDY